MLRVFVCGCVCVCVCVCMHVCVRACVRVFVVSIRSSKLSVHVTKHSEAAHSDSHQRSKTIDAIVEAEQLGCCVGLAGSECTDETHGRMSGTGCNIISALGRHRYERCQQSHKRELTMCV